MGLSLWWLTAAALLLSTAYPFTATNLTDKCASPSLGTPFGVYSEDNYTYIVYKSTTAITWSYANTSCATLFSSTGVPSKLASYRSATVQSGLQNTSAATTNLYMYIGFGLLRGSSTGVWLDPNSTYAGFSMATSFISGLYTVTKYYYPLKYYYAATTSEINFASIACEVQSKPFPSNAF
jgi:hypothetical protein